MLEVLNELTKDEFAKLGDFIRSPYYYKGTRMVKCYDFLAELYPEIKDDDDERRKLGSMLSEGKEITETYVRKQISDFISYFEKFLAILEQEKLSSQQDVALIQALHDRGFNKLYESRIKQYKKVHGLSFSKDETYYLNDYYIKSFEHEYSYSRTLFNYPQILQEKSDTLDLMFAFLKLHTFKEMQTQQLHNKKELKFNKTFYNEIQSLIESNLSEIKKSHPNLYIVYLVNRIFMEGDATELLSDLESYIFKNEKKFPKDKMAYYVSYLTFCYWIKINAGESSLKRPLFSLYEKMDKKGMLFPSKVIEHTEYNNPIMTAISIGETKWAEYFASKYKKHIFPPEFKESAFNLSMARIKFTEKDYESALNYASDVKYKTPHYYFFSRYLLIRIYFERGDYEGIRYILDAMEHYSRRNENEIHLWKSQTDLFIKYTNMLLKAGEGDDFMIHKISKLSDHEIDKTLVYRNWFIEKAEELKIKKAP